MELTFSKQSLSTTQHIREGKYFLAFTSDKHIIVVSAMSKARNVLLVQSQPPTQGQLCYAALWDDSGLSSKPDC